MANTVYSAGVPYLNGSIDVTKIYAAQLATTYTFDATDTMQEVAASRLADTTDAQVDAAWSSGMLVANSNTNLGLGTGTMGFILVYLLVTDDTDSIPLFCVTATGLTTHTGLSKRATWRASGSGGMVTVP